MDDLDPNRDDNDEVAMEIDETGDFRQGNKNARIQVSIIMSDLDMSKIFLIYFWIQDFEADFP